MTTNAATKPKGILSVGDIDLVDEVSKVVQKISGVQLGQKQYSMVQARLSKRILDLGLAGPEEYLAYLNDHRERESDALVSLLTTHHTFFFREFLHFEFLEKSGLEKIVQSCRSRGQKNIRVWSAACSRGQEVYSLAMFLSFHLGQIAPDMGYEIFGSDVDSDSVQIAKNGVYRWDEVKEIPAIYMGDNWSRGTGEIEAFVKAKETIRSHCKFETVNFFKMGQMAGQKFDLIFCRNVFIYFTPEQIKTITNDLLKNLNEDGYMFIGISESFNGMSLPVSAAGPSIYTHERKHLKVVEAPSKAQTTSSKTAPQKPTTAPAQTPKPSLTIVPAQNLEPATLKVLCVDDSPSILTILKKVLSKEAGFEVVGVAKNGLEAKAFLDKNKVDVMTLDIHMPEQNGVEYLEKNFNAQHPPVVMISSVSREDSQLGLRSLELGAIDYVEKPSLSNIAEKADEICTKIRCAFKAGVMKRNRAKQPADLAKSFKKNGVLVPTDQHVRVFIAGLGDREKIADLLKTHQDPQPATLILLHGPDTVIAAAEATIKPSTKLKVQTVTEKVKSISAGNLYIAHWKNSFEDVKQLVTKKKCSVLVFDSATAEILKKIDGWQNTKIIVEDAGGKTTADYQRLRSKSTHFVPYTSFIYHSDEDLMG